MFDPYQRRSAPQYWPDEVRAWANQAMRDGIPIYSGGPLTDEQALDWWMPLPWIQLAAMDGPGEVIGREEFGGSLGVILLWRDGTVHMGVPPQQPGDLLHLYRVARLGAEAFVAHGQAQDLANNTTPRLRAALH